MTTKPRAAQVIATPIVAAMLAALAACSTGHAVATTESARTSVQPTSEVPQPVPNLLITPEIRHELVAAGAALNGLSPTDYVGLVPGTAYLSYDPTSHTYWAGAALEPKSTSEPALVSTQDDGSYLLFDRRAGGEWRAADVGMAGVYGSRCPVPLPPPVRRSWGWPAGACHPVWAPSTSNRP